MTLAPAPIALESSRPAPVDSDERLHTLDILRGLALFGMILVHFHQKMKLEVTGPEDLIQWAVWILVEEKAWGIFAFLFGVGFAVLLRRLEARSAKVVPIYLRRMAMLAVFGVIAQVGFGFSILLSYACWGLALLVIRHWRTPALFAAAVFAACARPVAQELTAVYSWWTGVALPASSNALSEAVEAAARQGSYLTLLSARWALFLGSFPSSWRDLLPDTSLALFIVGLLAVRYRVLDEPRQHRRLIFGWMTFGALAWATHWLVLRNLPAVSIPGADWPLADGFGLAHDQWLSFSYIGALVLLLAYRPEWTDRLRAVGRAGRMALTNYLLQAMVLDVLASGYGFGLKIRPLLYLPAAIALFGSEAGFSRYWLERYRFGPLEWLWRSVTYWKWQPLRREELSLGNSI